MESRLYQYSVESLKIVAEKLKMSTPRHPNKQDLSAQISDHIEDMVKKKHKPKSDEEFKLICKTSLESLLSYVSDRHIVGGAGEEGDVANKLKLKNMRDRCYCGVKNNKKDNGMWITCTNQECSSKFHHDCLPWRMSDLENFECPNCIILNNDPLNDVIQILFDPSILISDYEYQFKLSFEQYSKMTEDINIGVEVRTIKLDGEHFFEQTWPDKCAIKINGKSLKEVKPLHQNSSLKKRRDEKLFNRQNIKTGQNTFSITYQNVQDGKNTKVKQDPKYVFVIVLVRKISVEELSTRIRNINRLSVERSKEFIKEKFLHNKDLEINEIKVNLIDNISFVHIKHPARGVYCDHVPCFSLEYFLQSMENNYTRKWACPICKKRCNKLVIDSYIEQVIEEAKKKNEELENVFFLKNGDVVFKSSIIDDSCGTMHASSDVHNIVGSGHKDDRREVDVKIDHSSHVEREHNNAERDIDDCMIVLSITSEEDSRPPRVQEPPKPSNLQAEHNQSNSNIMRLEELKVVNSKDAVRNNDIHDTRNDHINNTTDDHDINEDNTNIPIDHDNIDKDISYIIEDIQQNGAEQEQEEQEENILGRYYDIYDSIERREEPVIDRIVNQKLKKDEELNQDKDILFKIWMFIQQTKKDLKNTPVSNSQEYIHNTPNIIHKHNNLSKIINVLYNYTINRKQLLNISNRQCTKRYKHIMNRLARSNEYFSISDDEVLMVKRAERDPSSDTELLNSILNDYSMIDSNTPVLLPMKMIKGTVDSN